MHIMSSRHVLVFQSSYEPGTTSKDFEYSKRLGIFRIYISGGSIISIVTDFTIVAPAGTPAP